MCPNLECYAQAISHLQPTRDVPLQNQEKVDPKQWEQIFWIFPCGSDNFWRLMPCNFLILCAPSWQGQSLQEELHREVLTVGHWAYPGVIPLIFQSWSCFVAQKYKQFWYIVILIRTLNWRRLFVLERDIGILSCYLVYRFPRQCPRNMYTYLLNLLYIYVYICMHGERGSDK